MARLIEAELVAVCVDRFGAYFVRQLPPGREPVVVEDAAEVEVRFALRDARPLPNGDPDAYLVLRELRLEARSGRPAMHWYGLVERSPTGGSRYEAFHLHDEPERDVLPHFQVEERSDGTLTSYRQQGFRPRAM